MSSPPRAAKLGAVELRTISGIRVGASDGHKKGMMSMSKACDDSCAFTISSSHSDLHLEAGSTKERENWVKALQTLVQVYKTNPTSLRA